MIYRIQGKGSFIASEASVDEPSSMLDFDMLAQCERWSRRIVRELVCRDLPDVAMSTVQMFGGASRASVCRTDVRYLVDAVVALESIYLRRSDVNALPDCESEPVLRTLMAIRPRVSSVRESYHARSITAGERDAFGVEDGVLLSITRYVSDANRRARGPCGASSPDRYRVGSELQIYFLRESAWLPSRNVYTRFELRNR